MSKTKKVKKTESPIPDFLWPEFKNGNDHIRHNTAKYADCSIEEAFQHAYKVKLKSKTNTQSLDYMDVKVGDLLPLRILKVDKKNVYFDTDLFKEEIVCGPNIYQYKNFKEGIIPAEPIMCRVISRTSNKIEIDPITPQYDIWMSGLLANLRSQWHMTADRSILVENLRLTKFGFVGDMNVKAVSDITGQNAYIKVFIPGSQIVQNIEKNFEQWDGASVRAFVTGCNKVPNKNNQLSLICSVKEYLKFQGDKFIIDTFKHYTVNDQEWQAIQKQTYEGVVTGIINSNNKCGIFVEVPEIKVTGLIETAPNKLLNVKYGNKIPVNIMGFNEPTFYNDVVGQTQHKSAYIIENDILKKCNVKLIFGMSDVQ